MGKALPCIFYRDLFGAWRWECHDADGVVRDSQQSYDAREDCVESARAAGFHVDLPETTDAGGAAAPAGHSILCVQTDPDCQRFLRRALTGFETVAVVNGYEALRCLNSAVYDAYILEYWLPDWSGVSLCREIRKRDPHAPVCFYSRAAGEQLVKRGLSAGADAFVRAPVQAHALRAQIERLVSASEASSTHAKAEAFRTIQIHLEQRVQAAKQLVNGNRASLEQVLARSSRAKAMQAFMDAGSTRAGFERAWPQLFSTAVKDYLPAIEGGPACPPAVQAGLTITQSKAGPG